MAKSGKKRVESSKKRKESQLKQLCLRDLHIELDFRKTNQLPIHSSCMLDKPDPKSNMSPILIRKQESDSGDVSLLKTQDNSKPTRRSTMLSPMHGSASPSALSSVFQYPTIGSNKSQSTAAKVKQVKKTQI